MKFKKISSRMFTFVIPVLIVPMLVLTLISINNSKKAVTEQVDSRMESELKAAEGLIEEQLKGVTTAASAISDMVTVNYRSTTPEEYHEILARIIMSDDIILGSGLWFEPYAFDPAEKYFGPYVYKDGNTTVTTYEYSNEEYDYFVQEYYTNAKNSMKVMVTDPYYDETSGLIMSSCSAPIVDENGSYIGCVTVDIELSSIIGLVSNIRIGETGRAIMLDSAGTYLAGVDESKISAALNIKDDTDTALASVGKEVLGKPSGIVSYTPATGAETVYYSTLASTGWKVLIHISEDEVYSSVQQLVLLMSIISVIAVIVELIMIAQIIRDISKKTIKVKDFVNELAAGNFKTDRLSISTEDELGVMSKALNDMYDNNKEIISGIAGYASSLGTAASQLNGASVELETKFDGIRTMTSRVNDEMSTTSSATEEVNASSEEVLSNVSVLTGETEQSMAMSDEIVKRAADVAEKSRKSFETAQALTEKYRLELEKSIEGAKVVDNVSSLADVISSIADEINLLSLNASIESARAGEAGRGFAVVANEIGSLAGSTSKTVDAIQSTIADVQKAFSNLAESASELLDFVQTTVAPDYENFVEVADQYGKDAESFRASSSNISDMAGNIKTIIGEVTLAIQDIADATSETTDISRQIMEDVETVSGHISNVANMAGEQQNISDSLNNTVSSFKL